MISIQSCVNDQLTKRPFYLAMLKENTLNTTAFALIIKPKIEAIISKTVSATTIVACLARSKKNLKTPRKKQKIHSINVKYPLVWMSFDNLDESQKSQVVEQLPNLNSYYENKNNLVVSFKETMNQKPITVKNIEKVEIHSVCEIIIEYHNQYHSETGLFYEIAKEFYWANISIIDQSNSDRIVWIYVYSKDIEKSLEILRSKFVILT